MSKEKAMADPAQLRPFDADDKKLLRVIIETPKGSRNKFAFNEEERIFELKKSCPQEWDFPTISGLFPQPGRMMAILWMSSSWWTSPPSPDAS